MGLCTQLCFLSVVLCVCTTISPGLLETHGSLPVGQVEQILLKGWSLSKDEEKGYREGKIPAKEDLL